MNFVEKNFSNLTFLRELQLKKGNEKKRVVKKKVTSKLNLKFQ